MVELITPRALRWLPFALTALPYVVYLFLVFLLFNQVYEDSFIYFRVADNIAHGYGYVFNRGSENVETGSGLLWQLLLALGALLSLDLLLFKMAGDRLRSHHTVARHAHRASAGCLVLDRALPRAVSGMQHAVLHLVPSGPGDQSVRLRAVAGSLLLR